MDARLTSIERQLRIIQGLVSLQIALNLGLLWLLSTIRGRLP